MAVIQWREERVKVVPVLDANGTTVGQITLLPGWNEIEDVLWQAGRKWVKDLIAKGVIVEKGTVKTVKTTLPDGTEGEVEELAKVTLRSLKVDEALEVIKGTGNLNSLQKWLDNESRDEIRIALIKAIDEVNKVYPTKEAPPVARRKLF